MKSYTTPDIPEAMWVHWRRLTPHEQSLPPRSRRLYAADVACAQKHGQGIIETAIEEGLIDEQDIQDAFDIEYPDDYNSDSE
ncbi:hypothetical protein [Halalkalicoccus jeotgali]|uniref:Uncharacterized protein n=1 Tax=Halalkalicoccus jeotgali (strain DSM 18796 / CECT 7217 / JCM 14584 / KCTC 4019 / B3) TaxID=795797 RepID=D8JD26_HALJB|nr:hypothetical protein [Halalkalicoccus jeotgali]ADJ17179.1 hypothetical protein HacjB3_19208 [Halalkalicoccus jeotgali B3]ELY41167.1 hypothetical protein C497_01977 [Halalkalicoccus jeotgali B3]